MATNTLLDLYIDNLQKLMSSWSSSRITVPTEFSDQMEYINNIFSYDESALIMSVINFMIRSANVDISFNANKSGLNKLFSDWKRDVNKNLNMDIPRGLRSLGEQYFRERWKSSFLVLRIRWSRVDGYLMPTTMYFMDGASIKVKNEAKKLNTNKYYFNKKEIRESEDETIIIRKPYNQLYDQYPTPYLVHRGTLYHYLKKKAILTKQTEMLGSAFPYKLLLKLGSDELVRQKSMPSETELNELADKFSKLKSKSDTHPYSPGIAGAFPHFFNLEEFIPDLKKILDDQITRGVDKDLLCSLGLIELKGFSSTREEAILNPKVLIEEVIDAILDYVDLLQEIVLKIQEKNSGKYTTNDIVTVQPGIIKSFLTDKDKEIIRSVFDRGQIGQKSFLESVTALNFETQVKERDHERRENLDVRMFPRVVQNQDNGLNDLNENVPDDKKKKSPESLKYKSREEIQEDVDKANETTIIICKNCGEEIDYLDEPEVGMGKIKCPFCETEIDQEGNFHKAEKELIIAPYSKPSDLPESVKNNMTVSLQRVFINVVNNALKNGDSEEVAFRKAWSQISKIAHKNKKGKWVPNKK